MPNPRFGRQWTAEENDFLRQNAGKMLVPEMSASLSRSPSSVQCRLSVLGIRNRPDRRPWSPAETDKLRLIIGSRPLPEVARLFGRTERSISGKCCELGIRLPDITQGMETIGAAAIRHKMDDATMQRIVQWARVGSYRLGFQLDSKRPKYGRMYYESADIDDAVDRWTRYETLTSASRRTGWSVPALHSWLTREGVKILQLRNAKRKHTRVPREEVDRVVAKYSSTETIECAASRHGMTAARMRRTLVASGLIGGDRILGIARLVPADVDRVIAELRNKERLAQASRRVGISQNRLRRWVAESSQFVNAKLGKHYLLPKDFVDNLVAKHTQAA